MALAPPAKKRNILSLEKKVYTAAGYQDYGKLPRYERSTSAWGTGPTSQAMAGPKFEARKN